MSIWGMKELQDWDDKICKLGAELGLDWYPIDYEICDYREMIDTWHIQVCQLIIDIGPMVNLSIEFRQNITLVCKVFHMR